MDGSKAPETSAVVHELIDELRGRSPECAFWNMCLWNQFLHAFDYAYERVTINGGQVV